MVLVNLSYTKENLWGFIKYNTLSSTPFRRTVKYMYFAVLAVMLIFGVTMAIVMGNILYAVLMFCMGAVFFGVGAFMIRTLKSAANNMQKELAEQSGMQAALNSEIILIRSGSQAIGYVTWDSIATISITPDFAYLTTKEDALLLLEYKQIVNGVGDKNELIALLKDKSELLRQNKKAKKAKTPANTENAENVENAHTDENEEK
jgi:hypothetical protein